MNKYIYDITDYGAVGDGVTDCTEAIQRAVDQCAGSGGTVMVPKGRYLITRIVLGSDMELHLAAGAVLLSVYPGQAEYLISAQHARNITISGQGMIDGQGSRYFHDDDADGGAHECPLSVNGEKRARTTYFEDVDNLVIRDITFHDAAMWTLHMAGCRNVLVDHIVIRNNDRGPNNDGIDPDTCQNVVIRNCMISTGDDAIVVKTTDRMAASYGACCNVVITGCILHSRDSALKIGTETHGNIHHITMSDCIVEDCSRAVGIWSRDAGQISDIHISHVSGNTRQYTDCPGRGFAPRWWGKGEPVFLSATKRAGSDVIPGGIRDVYMDHLNLKCESSVFMGGEPYTKISHVRIVESSFHWMRQGTAAYECFDEQPSARDVYPHSNPCVYGRNVEDAVIEAEMQVDPSMAGVIREKEMLDACRNVVVR